MKTKKIITLLLIIMLLLSFSGCRLFSVNEEKDNASTVATVNGKTITKAQFKDFLTTYYVLYGIYGYAIPEGDSLDEFKLEILDYYISELCYYEEALTAEIAPEEDYLETTYTELYDSAVASMGSEEAFLELLAKYNMDKESFKAVSEEYRTLYAYYTAYTATEPDYHDAVVGTAMTVNKKDISIQTFNYYNEMIILLNYASYYSYPQSEEEYLKYADMTVNYVAYTQSLNDYADEHGYEISDDDAVAAFDENYSLITQMFSQEYLDSLFKSYYMTEEEIREAKIFIGKSFVTEDLIQAELEADYTASREDVEEYYANNTATFSATVSAYHILTEDEARAKELVRLAGTTEESFMELYNSIKATTDATIKEAADLGTFVYGKMLADFSEPVFAMQVGEVKGMIKTEFGYHLVFKYAETPEKTLENDYAEIEAKYVSSQVSAQKLETVNKIGSSGSVKADKEDYRKTHATRVDEYLREKYNVKIYKKVAIR